MQNFLLRLPKYSTKLQFSFNILPVTSQASGVTLRSECPHHFGRIKSEMTEPQHLVLVVENVIHGQRNGLQLAVGKLTSDDGLSVAHVGDEQPAVVYQ